LPPRAQRTIPPPTAAEPPTILDASSPFRATRQRWAKPPLIAVTPHHSAATDGGTPKPLRRPYNGNLLLNYNIELTITIKINFDNMHNYHTFSIV
jgi:hypothetical protein